MQLFEMNFYPLYKIEPRANFYLDKSANDLGSHRNHTRVIIMLIILVANVL